MKHIKILQFGDMHFDTPFSELSANESEKRKEDLRETFGKIISIAKEEMVHAILLTGDLFDSSRVSKSTIDYMIKMFYSILNIKVFISPGNHDPLGEKSFYKILKWPENVHIFKEELEGFMLDELNTVIYGVGFSKLRNNDNLLKNFTVADSESISIMVMHGDLGGGKSSLYNPIEEIDIENSKLDYLALGHKHTFSGINKSGNTYWAYSGNPEGRGFDEVGSKGIILGEIGKGYVDLRYIETCKRKYFVENVDITGACNYEDIVLNIREKLKSHRLEDNTKDLIEFKRRNLFKFILEGKKDKDFTINLSVLKEKFSDEFFYMKAVDNTEANFDYISMINEFSLKGLYLKKIKERIENAETIEDKKILDQALKIGLDCLDLKEVTIDDN